MQGPRIAKCTNCPAEIELSVEGEDIGAVAYKLVRPVLRAHYSKTKYDVDLSGH